MPQDSKLEEGTSRPVTREFKRTKSKREATTYDYGTMTKSLGKRIKEFGSEAKSLLIPQRPLRHVTFLIWCTYSMFIDPLILYTPVINDDKKCFKLAKTLRLLAIGRSFMDFHFLINSYLEMKDEFKEIFRVSPLLVFLFDLSIVLPLPQVLLIQAASQRMKGRKFFDKMNFFIIQHLLKDIRLYTLVTKPITSVENIIWARFKINLSNWARVTFYLSFFHATHVIGALYYFFALKRKIECWGKACLNHTGCDQLLFYCDKRFKNYTFSNDFCSTNTQTIATYDFGIFKDAIQFGLVEESNFFQRFFASIRWSLQNLSSFGQGLPFSTNIWENIFVMFITISGVVLFFFLIAKVQFEMSKSEEIRQKVQEIERWLPFGKLPKKLQNEVKEHHSSKWIQTRGVDVEYLVNNLQEDLRKKIKQNLCLDMLKKVDEFRNWSDTSLEDLCDVVKPVLFTERSYIVREGDPIDQILFVLQGKLWTCSFRSTTGSSSPARSKNNQLRDGDSFGEELVTWAKADLSASNLPLSTRTIQALTNVEAFVLMADDLKTAVQLIRKKKKAVRFIQLFWQMRKIAQTSAQGTPLSLSSRTF